MDIVETVLNLFKMRFTTEEILKNMGVVRSQKITEDYGEWLAEQLFNGTRAVNVNQRGWDIDIGGIQHQIKTHCKADTNATRYTKVKNLEYPIIIFQLRPNYSIKNIFSISKENLSEYLVSGNLRYDGNEYHIYWSKCDNITEQYIHQYPFLFQ